MRPLKLEMQAFGPYAQKEVIDFRLLDNRTMFVISGKTGAGKTSIFDGISFAVYGKSSGEDRGGIDLRSHFAAEELQTEVSLQFSLRDKSYYIWRTPQQEKKKSRGEGYTVVNAKAELYEIDETGNKKILAANVRETDEQIKGIIGLDFNQFRQILMIPQGDFRKLLTSDSKDKEAILQRLFHTETYKKIEEKLKEKASLLKQEAQSGIAARSRVLREMYTNGQAELEAALSEDVPNDTVVLSLAGTVTDAMAIQIKEMRKEIVTKQQKRDFTKRKVDEAAALQLDMENREQLRKTKTEMAAKTSEIEQLKKEVNRAQRASHLVYQEEACQKLKREHDTREERLEALNKTAEKTNVEKDRATVLLDKLKSEKGKQDTARAELAQLERNEENITGLSAKRKLENELKQRAARLQEDVQAVRRALKDNNETTQHLQKDLKELRKLQSALSEWERQNLGYEVKIQLIVHLEEAQQKEMKAIERLSVEEKKITKITAALEDARKTESYLEEQWFAGQAAVLAQKLSEGEACSVCGSTSHPAPAHAQELPQEADLKAAKQQVHELTEEKSEEYISWANAKSNLNQVQENKESALRKAEEGIPDFSMEQLKETLAHYQEKYRRLQSEISAAKQKTATIAAKEANLEEHEKEKQRLEKELDQALETEKGISEQHFSITAEMRSLIDQLPEGLDNEAAYQKKTVLLRKQISDFDRQFEEAASRLDDCNKRLASLHGQLGNTKEELQYLGESLTAEREKFKQQLAEHEFEGYQDYASAKRDAADIEKKQHKIMEFAENYRSLTDRLADYEKRLAGKEKPDMEALQKELAENDVLLQQLNERAADLKMHHQNNENVARQVVQMNREIKQVEEQYELIGHLSDMTRGQNSFRLTFERFVLATFLDDILRAANDRLLKMTSGRYQMLRKKDRSKGNVQSGLELLVFDQYTGVERHVKTLSGGESFKASLSLALGLADVVQEHAGGVSLETMFIDEGFGTLDPESLDQAIEALMDIQSSGRLVGIISHVPDLKERIDARLEVMAGQDGSRTEFIFAS